MNDLIWKSEEQQQKELKERIESWKPGLSRDGYIVVASGEFLYKKIAFQIHVLRYYNHTDKFCPLGSERTSDKHAVVEYPEKTKPLVELLKSLDIGFEYFLWHDTLNSWNEKQTCEEQIGVAYKFAKEDIDSLKKVPKLINSKIKELKEAKKKLRELTK